MGADEGGQGSGDEGGQGSGGARVEGGQGSLTFSSEDKNVAKKRPRLSEISAMSDKLLHSWLDSLSRAHGSATVWKATNHIRSQED